MLKQLTYASLYKVVKILGKSTPNTPSAFKLWMVLDGITVFAAAFFATVLGVADYPIRDCRWFSSGNSLGAGDRGAVEAFRTQRLDKYSAKVSKVNRLVSHKWCTLRWQNTAWGVGT